MKKILLLSLGLACIAPVIAAGQMKPGLWEMTMKSDAMKAMPKIPPAQAEQMRRMGVDVPQFQDGGMVSKVCITPQMASQSAPGLENMQAGCQAKNVVQKGNSYSADIVCSGDMMKGSGKVEGNHASDQRFISTYDFKGTVHGQPVSQRHETSGRWLGADCGSVKPVTN